MGKITDKLRHCLFVYAFDGDYKSNAPMIYPIFDFQDLPQKMLRDTL